VSEDGDCPVNLDSDHELPRASWVAHTQLLLDTFASLLGRELIDRQGSEDEQAERLFYSPFVIVSADASADPLLTYGNQTALGLWEMDADTLLATPARHTAEPVHRHERQRLLDRTRAQGYVDDYAGIRISSTGKRFRIEQAIVWNLTNATGAYCGQAATFDRWVPLP
jgi:hypothetical protein